MPVHTFEIIRDVDTSLNEEELVNTFASLGFSDRQIHDFISDNTGRTTFLPLDLTDDYTLRGLNKISLMRMMIGEASIPRYYILLEVNPLLDQNGPAYLYVPSKENNDNLVIKFRDIINATFDCDDDFADLRTWRANRVDYTHDFIFDTKEQAELFKLLPHKTSKEVRRKKIMDKAKKKYEQSVAEGNKSIKVTVYDKVKEVLENREGYEEDTLAFIARLLGHRVRFEVQCKRKKVISITRTGKFSRSIMNFLDEALASSILRTHYEQTIGTGDFYSEYHCWKRLEGSNLRPTMKTSTVRSVAASFAASVCMASSMRARG